MSNLPLIMDLLYLRMSYQGEIHLASDIGGKTLCGEQTGKTWVEVAPVDDKWPQLCSVCVEEKEKTDSKDKKE